MLLGNYNSNVHVSKQRNSLARKKHHTENQTRIIGLHFAADIVWVYLH